MKTFQFAEKVIQKVLARGKTVVEEKKYWKIAENYDFNGYRRIYYVHIRKTGGTSLNNMFLALSGEDSSTLYARLAGKAGHRLLSNGLIYVGWNVRLINSGNYFYAFSHTPIHKLALPEGTFTVSCFRDPVKRVLSHYSMLMDFHVSGTDHPCMETEGKWLGNGFCDFLRNIPKEHLLNQLYMFSNDFNVDEAIYNVRQLCCCFFTDEFAEGVNEINSKTGLNLEPIHIRKTRYRAQISEYDLAKLRKMLAEEYSFLNSIRQQLQ